MVLSRGKKKVAPYLYKGTNIPAIRQKTIVEIFSTFNQFKPHSTSVYGCRDDRRTYSDYNNRASFKHFWKKYSGSDVYTLLDNNLFTVLAGLHPLDVLFPLQELLQPFQVLCCKAARMGH